MTGHLCSHFAAKCDQVAGFIMAQLVAGETLTFKHLKSVLSLLETVCVAVRSITISSLTLMVKCSSYSSEMECLPFSKCFLCVSRNTWPIEQIYNVCQTFATCLSSNISPLTTLQGLCDKQNSLCSRDFLLCKSKQIYLPRNVLICGQMDKHISWQVA